MPRTHALRWALAGVVGLGVALTVTALGQDAADEAEKTEPLVRRVYDVLDLLMAQREDELAQAAPTPPVWTGLSWMPPSYPPPGSIDRLFMDRPFVGEARPSQQDLGRELAAAVRRTVNVWTDPDVASWADDGGPATAAIDYMDGALVVTQTRHGHEKVGELLALLRKHARASGRAVTVDARWVAVDEAKAADILGGADAAVPHELGADDLEKAGAKVLYRGRTTGINRRALSVACGRIRSYLADVDPVVSEGAVGVEPTMGAGLFGAMLQVRPELAPGGGSAILDVHSVVYGPGEIRARPLPDFAQVQGKAESMKLDLDTVNVPVTMFQTTVRVPLGKAVLVGATSAGEVLDGKIVCLILRVTASK